jgi:hypothetical protein
MRTPGRDGGEKRGGIKRGGGEGESAMSIEVKVQK